jgi:outer membrane protein OmpA-like peptidoglycan-associated protein
MHTLGAPHFRSEYPALLEDLVNKYYQAGNSGLRSRTRGLTKNMKIGIGAGVAVIALIVVTVVIPTPIHKGTHLIWVTEKTTRAPGTIPVTVRDRIRELSGSDGGQLTVYAAGNRVEQVDSIDLDVKQEGDRVSDPDLRNRILTRRLTDLTGKLKSTNVGAQGFSLYHALRVGADEAASKGEPVEVWLSTTVLSASADPLSVPTLTKNEADPSQAVDEVLKGSIRELDLSLVELHLVLLTPVGDGQQELNPRSESWRNAFIKKLGDQLRATVIDPLRDPATTPAWPNSSNVPPIVPMTDKTPEPPAQVPATTQAPPRIDNAAFLPDSATLINPDSTRRAVSQVVDSYKRNPGQHHVQVTGYCAEFGQRDSAVRTSRERAMTISTLLQEAGVAAADIQSDGKGFNERADPTKDSRAPEQRVVIIRLVAKP